MSRQPPSAAGEADPTAVAAAALLRARSTGEQLAQLPPGSAPADRPAAYAIQELVARSLGPVAGWKVGAAGPSAEPFLAPLHRATVAMAGATFDASALHRIGVEAEIVYLVGRDLPPRAQAYGRDEVLAAMAGVHPAIELVDSRFRDLAAVDRLSQLADQQNHGALLVGPPAAAWAGVDAAREPVRLTIDGELRAEAVGGNSAGDPVRLLVWLANEGSRAWGGLRAGEAITTGSCTGTLFVRPSVRVCARFEHLGSIAVQLR